MKLILKQTMNLAVALWTGLACLSLAAAEPVKSTRPKWPEVEKIVQGQFKEARRKPSELISQADIKPIFDELAKAGWKVPDQADILKLVPADGDPLVKQLRSPSAKKALNGIGSRQGVYDRLDRMIALPEGQQFLRDVLSWPDPSKMLKTLTTTNQGADLAGSLTNSPPDKDFTKPTGRLYTSAAFTARLKKSHDATEPRVKEPLPQPATKPGRPGRRP
ncbi:MAG: hypothetical protein AB7O62_01125 [Pirellulales bacterium]